MELIELTVAGLLSIIISLLLESEPGSPRFGNVNTALFKATSLIAPEFKFNELVDLYSKSVEE